MKILIYAPTWKTGGLERLISLMLASFAERWPEYEFTLWTEECLQSGLEYRLPPGAELLVESFQPFSQAAEARLRRLIEDRDPDVLVSMGSTGLMAKMPLAALGARRPVIISEHLPESRIVTYTRHDYRILNAMRGLADINHVIFPEFAASHPEPERLRVIPNPIGPSRLQAVVDRPGPKRIIHTGRYHLEQKQQDVLIKGFARLAETFPDWRLDFYGEDQEGERPQLVSLVRALGLEERVGLHDPVAEVDEVLAAGSLFAFPSAYEAFGLSVGEALAAGLPVVAFADCPGVNRLVISGRNGLLTPGDLRDDAALAAALAELMSDPDLRRRLAEGARASVREFSLNRFVLAWKSLLDEACALRAAPGRRDRARRWRETRALIAGERDDPYALMLPELIVNALDPEILACNLQALQAAHGRVAFWGLGRVFQAAFPPALADRTGLFLVDAARREPFGDHPVRPPSILTSEGVRAVVIGVAPWIAAYEEIRRQAFDLYGAERVLSLFHLGDAEFRPL